MFLSANSLITQYGIDEEIAQFYVDREPPKDNLYWKDKLLYLRPQPGYLFFPMITDLFYRSGISKQSLLGGRFVPVAETVVHYAAEEEWGLISKHDAVQNCMHLVDDVTDKYFLEQLAGYFNGKENFISGLATPFRALHRGDLFLFSLCVLDISRARQTELVRTWFALISTLLLLDDAEDIESDRSNNEENAFLESGENAEGFRQIKQLLTANLDHLSGINTALAHGLHRKFSSIAEKPFIKELLNA